MGLLGLAILVVAMPALSFRAAGALSVPKAGVVEVTEFRQPGISGSVGPVVIVATGGQAAALRAALNGLAPWSSQSACDNALGPFVVSLVPRQRSTSDPRRDSL